MFIKEIQVHKQNLELSRPYSIAFKTVNSVENVIVKVVADDGSYGLGSGNPSQEVVGESIDDSMIALSEENLEWLIGKDVRHIFQVSREVTDKFSKKPASCAALDIALHDLFCKKLDVPLAAFLGQCKDTLPTSITIGIKGVEETIEEAREYLARGFQILKVKLGKTLEEDIERLYKLREGWHRDIIIRVDANQGYDPASLMQFYRKTQDLDLELIEQPLPANAIEKMKSLPQGIKIKMAADESLLGPEQAFLLASSPKACGIFNIKLMKSGGITRAREIATIAMYSDIDLMWGCNDESVISISAALHTAFSCPSTKYLDLDGSLDLAMDVATGGFVIKEGMMSITGGAGLGVDINSYEF